MQAKEVMKPCPFCGKKDSLFITDRKFYDELVAEHGQACITAECRRCQFTMYEHTREFSDYGVRLGLLISKWNGRANEVNG